MKKLLCCLLALFCLLGLSPALNRASHASEDRTVSPWAAEEIARAEGYGLLDVGDLRADYAAWTEEVTDWTQPITRAMFLRFALSYAAVMNHSDRLCFQNAVNRLIAERTEDGYFLVDPFTDDRSEEAAAAWALGITQGRGGGIFDPNSRITRQEAAAMLCRAYTACGGEALPAGEAEPFADEASIAPWAAEAVHTLRSRGVLRGMEDGSFDPQGDFTIQQCALCFLRLSEEMPVSFLKGNAAHLFTQEQLISAIQPDYDIKRWDGPLAAFIRRDEGTVLGDTAFFLVYADGGIRRVEAAVPVHSYAPAFDSAGFSGDGMTFTYTMTLQRDDYALPTQGDQEAGRDPALLSAAGFYTVTVDVLSGSQTADYAPLEPKESRWEDVPADAWYAEAAEYCVDMGLISETEGRFDPEGTVTRGQLAEAAAHVHSFLTTGDWSLHLRPEDWGVAVFRLKSGRELPGFRAWEKDRWRTWNGPMYKDNWHYTVSAELWDVLEEFPQVEEAGAVFLPATLDMGDKQVVGSLGVYMNIDREEGGPGYQFYPDETSGYKNGGLLEPGAPTLLFLCAQPGSAWDLRGVYYLAEKELWWEQAPEETALGLQLVELLCGLRRSPELPAETFRPIRDVTLPEGTAYRVDLEPLVRAGLLDPEDPDWTFDPAAPVTRAQFAAVLWRLLNPEAR